MKKRPGFLIAFEGIDGCGKSTLSKLVFEQLQQLNLPVILTKEPGGTPQGQLIRALVHGQKFQPTAEFLLFCADRAEHIAQVIIPGLDAGKIIISDRMADSSRAYQGYGRGLDLQFINTVTHQVMQGIVPDLIVYRKIDADTAFARIVQRNEQLTLFEKEKKEFFERVITGFDTLFAGDKRVLTLDSTLSLQEACDHVVQRIISLVKP